MSGALTLVGVGECEVTATAAATVNYDKATRDTPVTVSTGVLQGTVVRLITGDGTVNIAEHEAGFAISRDTNRVRPVFWGQDGAGGRRRWR